MSELCGSSELCACVKVCACVVVITTAPVIHTGQKGQVEIVLGKQKKKSLRADLSKLRKKAVTCINLIRPAIKKA